MRERPSRWGVQFQRVEFAVDASQLAALLREEPTPVALLLSETPATARSLDMPPLGTMCTPAENVLTPSRSAARHADAWLGDVLADVLTAGLPAW